MDRRRDIAKRIDMFGQWGDVTLLFQEQNGQPGLQVYLPTESAKKQSGLQLIQGDVDLESGTWISAPIIPNTVLVNIIHKIGILKTDFIR